MRKYQQMNKFITLFFVFFLSCNVGFAKYYKLGEIVEGEFKIGPINIKLPAGKWVTCDNATFEWGGITLSAFEACRIENKEILEVVVIFRGRLGASHTSYLDEAVYRTLFVRRIYDDDGCFEKPRYTVLEFYQRGHSHNCFVVDHFDTKKEPDNPELKGSDARFKKWVKDNDLKYDSIGLGSFHSYFTRLSGKPWYMIGYKINPKLLGAVGKKITEESSEFHPNNIDDYPKHKEVMEKWVSISAKRHLEFEKIIKAKSHHLLDLSKYIFDDGISENIGETDLTDEIIKLKKLLDEGVITQEEFTKAKKKLLN